MAGNQWQHPIVLLRAGAPKRFQKYGDQHIRFILHRDRAVEFSHGWADEGGTFVCLRVGDLW